MSGHSKWHNIQGRKSKQDAKKSSQFSKYSKAITIAAQRGGDPAMNFSLRLAIDRAKAAAMPKDNIERAIKKGTGELNDGSVIEEVIYEAYGPGGVAIIIKCLTDNKNRTISDIKHILSERGGSLGGSGSVMWMFNLAGVILLDKTKVADKNRDEFDLSLIESGAQDISEENGQLEIRTNTESLQKVVSFLRNLGIEPEDSGLKYIAKDEAQINDETREKLSGLFEELEANEDVDDYYTNAG
jgi:YebC/PmpR family DNA-binding regulatory protein